MARPNLRTTLSRRKSSYRGSGFTIVELLIVVVVIVILATITVVAYNGITKRAKETTLKSDLTSGASQLQLTKAETSSYPGNADGLKKSEGTEFTYTGTTSTFCLAAGSNSLPGVTFHVTENSGIQEGGCPAPLLQVITSSSCPTSRTRAVDARDNHTYWVQKFDGRCWMLTNLGYAGGGTNTFSDAKTLANGTGGSTTYTNASYYIVPSTTNYTTEPANPSTSTDGTGQYGLLYNWCAAMGGQTSTSACAAVSTPNANAAISVCPSGWTLPTRNDFIALVNAVNDRNWEDDTGLRTNWYAQQGGYWRGTGFMSQGNVGFYWTANPYDETQAYLLYLGSTWIDPGEYGMKYEGNAVRCISS